MINRISVKEIIELVNKDNNIPKKGIIHNILIEAPSRCK